MITTTQTAYGRVQGILMDGYAVYKGIPYAKAPVGELRWKMPEQPEKWDGIRVCDTFGNIAMQRLPDGEQSWSVHFKREFYDNPEFIPPMSEDCLFLNIWTPAVEAGEKLPVAFWIHGGGFGGGYSSEIEFDGEALAKEGIVLVTINYRCGAFGFLAHPWLSAESERGISGNYGTFDQIAALEWVYENISAFGGDPENITVFGQSAGCMSTQVLVSTELTGDRIKKAVLQSGPQAEPPFFAMPTLETEEKYGERIVEITGAKNIEELRRLPAEALLAAKDQFDFEIMQKMMSGEDTEGVDFLRIVPCVDGYLLKKNVYDTYMEGTMRPIPYMAGCVEDDLGTTDADREKKEPGLIGDNSLQWCVKQDRIGNPPAYCYLFRHRLPTENGEEIPFHSSELWYSFGTLSRCWRPMKKEDYELSRIMVKSWAGFIKTGEPGGEWRPCREADPYVKEFF